MLELLRDFLARFTLVHLCTSLLAFAFVQFVRWRYGTTGIVVTMAVTAALILVLVAYGDTL